MMRSWVSLLPLFVVRRLALRYGERYDYRYEGRIRRVFAQATRDCFFKVEDSNDAAKENDNVSG
jgi:hypothetical protein